MALRRLLCERMLGPDYELVDYFGLCDDLEARNVEDMLLYY